MCLSEEHLAAERGLVLPKGKRPVNLLAVYADGAHTNCSPESSCAAVGVGGLAGFRLHDWQGLYKSPRLFERLQHNRTCRLSPACVYRSSGDRRRFVLADAYAAVIDYLSIDPEGSELAILEVQGYPRREAQWDDWYWKEIR